MQIASGSRSCDGHYRPSLGGIVLLVVGCFATVGSLIYAFVRALGGE